jgi:hypothetical protein
MSVESKVFDQLNKVELKSQKIELGLYDDLKISLNSLQNQIFIDKDVYNKSLKISSNLELLKKEAKERFDNNESIIQSSFKKIQLAEKDMAKAERIAKELGVEVNTFPNYKELVSARIEAQDNIKKLSSVSMQLKSLI